jgi:hypothetical protein
MAPYMAAILQTLATTLQVVGGGGWGAGAERVGAGGRGGWLLMLCALNVAFVSALNKRLPVHLPTLPAALWA